MTKLLTVPMKKPTDVDVVRPLENLINTVYKSPKDKDISKQIREFSNLRNNAVLKSYEQFEGSLEIIYTYYDQVVALENKIPQNELHISFKWKDAFNRGSGIFGGRNSLTISSLGFERVCVLFNIAALQSSIASAQDFNNDEGLKIAAKLFQQSAGIFNHLKDCIMSTLQQESTPDLNPETLLALSSLMFAQAQEIFVHKAIHDNRKEAVIAKLANQTGKLYMDALKHMQNRSVQHLWDKMWLPVVESKQSMFFGMADFYQSRHCHSNKFIGEEIARLKNSLEILKTAQLCEGNSNIISNLIDTGHKHLIEAIKDNDFIYHEKIPDYKSLESIGGAVLVKVLPIPPKLSNNFYDLFENLIPLSTYQSLITVYDNLKIEFINSEVAKLHEATNLINSVLAFLNFPAALDEVSTNQVLSESLVKKFKDIRDFGGISAIDNMLRELPKLLMRNMEIVNETERMMNEEKLLDDQLRDRFKTKWNRISSEELTKTFKLNLQNYRNIIDNASRADKIVQDKYQLHKQGIALLSEDPVILGLSIPSTGGRTIDNSSSLANKLKTLMEEVNTMKRERNAIELELKSKTKDTQESFLSALHDKTIQEQELSMEVLNKYYGHLQQKVKNNLSKQESLLAEIQKSNNDFVPEHHGRKTMLKDLVAAYDTCKELLDNLKEGTKFYNDLTLILLEFQGKISDFCFARKTEREEMIKDLTRGIGLATTTEVPDLPQHHKLVCSTTLVTDQSKQLFPNTEFLANSTINTPYPTQFYNMPQPYSGLPQSEVPDRHFPSPFPSGYQPHPQAYPSQHLGHSSQGYQLPYTHK
ncbi:Rhophilin, Rho GTPase binding protein [Homalodisca vitripennis]|nr:Rhophilin, Rho GTPase binding protein [Homalodisca vitripennis]